MVMAETKDKPQDNTRLLDYTRALGDAKAALKRVDKKLVKAGVPKGTQYDWLNNTSYNNIIYPKDKIPDQLLRLTERRNGIVGSIVTLRIQQSLEFCHISHDRDVPGWEIALKDDKKKITPEQERQKSFLEDLTSKSRIEGYESIDGAVGDFKDLLIKFVRDRMLIDKVCWEMERDRKGQVVALWSLDGATIYPVLPGGFYGSVSQIGAGIGWGYKLSSVSDEIRKSKLDQIPPAEEIDYVQELLFGTSGGGVTAAFRDTDLLYDLGNELNDIRYYKQGMSVTEKANVAIVAFINSLTFNSNGLSRGAIPKVALAMGKDSNYTQEQLEDAQDEWMANFESMDGQWNIPLLNSDAKVLNLLPTNRDMEYQKYMEFVGALTCSIMGADSAEIGLRLNQAQNVLSENNDGKQIFSKNRGLREILGGHAYLRNKMIQQSGYPFANDFMFRFNGLSTEDKGFEADLKKKKAETYMTIDEIRAEEDLPALKDGLGEVVLNTVWMQNKQAKEQAAQMASMEGEGGDEEDGFGGFSDEDLDGAVDDAMQGMEKGVRLI